MAEDASLASPSDLADDEVLILGELIGAYQLSPEEHIQGLKDKHLRPFCVVKFQDKTIHYSSPSEDSGRDPIWTVSTGSLFLLKVSPTTLAHDNLQINIWSKKNVTSLRGKVLLEDVDHYFLGKANLDGRALLSNCDEQRLELTLEDHQGQEQQDESTLALRFRLATESDVRLIELLRQQGISPPTQFNDISFNRSDTKVHNNHPVKDLILGEGSQLPIAEVISETNTTQMAGESLVNAISFAFRTSSKNDRETGLRKVRVKPGPDPSREKETKFMTGVELSKETRKPSKAWVQAGSGHIGTLHLEILSCHDLPNVDVGEAVGNLSDCFVTAVFEDVMVQTPVIDDELSPHWLPWTQRAFRIGIVHPASVLYLAVFDYDLVGDHEAIGRVAVNLTNFQSDMIYNLTYKLHPTSDLAERTPNGSITFRMRIEYKDQKAAVLTALQPTPVFHVNTRRQRTFKILRYTCFGEHDNEEKFTWAVTRSYIGEILEYWRTLKFYFGQCLWSLVFWRGQVQIYSMNLPVHSACLFISGAVLIERPWLIVPFYCLWVAWFMLATMSHRRQTPSPWHTCNSFLHYAEILLTGKARDAKEKIRPLEYVKRTEEFDKTVEEWKERYQITVDSKAAMEEKLLTIGDENISTTVAGQMMPLDLLEKLGRYQGMIGRFLTKFRRFKSIIIWENSMASFWITAVCLLAGLVTLLLPWRFILYFIGRLVVWGLLGPHMKLVDIYLHSNKHQQASKELEEFRKQSRLARMRREEAIKLKDMKCLAFGKYVTLVPSENLPRHYDRPLHQSFSRYDPSASKDLKPPTSRIPGQQLYGSMIPHTKAGLVAYQEDKKQSEIKLASLEEQVTRLLSIEQHVSSRKITAGLDEDLPDDLGYEVTLCDDKGTFEEEDGKDEEKNQEQEQEAPKSPVKNGDEVTLALSPIGLRGDNKAEKCTVAVPKSPEPQSSFLSRTANLLLQEKLIEEEIETQSSCDRSVAIEEVTEPICSIKSEETNHQSYFEPGVEVDQDEAYRTPVDSYSEPEDKPNNCLSYMTPLSDQNSADQEEPTKEQQAHSFETAPHEEEKKEQEGTDMREDVAFLTPERPEEESQENVSTTLDFLQLKIEDSESVQGGTPVSNIGHQILGPRQKTAIIQVKSIGSGSLKEPVDIHLESNEGKEGIQVKRMGTGSLKNNSEDSLELTECQQKTSDKQLVVDVCQPTESMTPGTEAPTPKMKNTGSQLSHDTSTNEDKIGSRSSTISTRSSAAAETAHSLTQTTTAMEESTLGSTIGDCQTSASFASTVTTITTNLTRVDTAVTRDANKYASQSLVSDPTADPLMVRRTWSSSSLQREKTWIKENPSDSVFELNTHRSSVKWEEGLEIVAMGRLRTIGDENECAEEEEDDDDDDNEQTESEPESPSQHRGLSNPYRSNSFVQVAHYRP